MVHGLGFVGLGASERMLLLRLAGSVLLEGMKWCAKNHESVVFFVRGARSGLLVERILTMRG